MGDEERPLSPTDAAILAIIKEMTESAADRIIANKEREKPLRRILTPGHMYFIIGCITLLALVAAGAFTKGG